MRNFNAAQPPTGHNPFIVPEGYFTQFAERMMSRIGEPAVPVVQMAFVRWVPWLGAASVAALLGVFTHFFAQDPVAGEHESAQASAYLADQTYEYIMTASAENDTDYEVDF